MQKIRIFARFKEQKRAILVVKEDSITSQKLTEKGIETKTIIKFQTTPDEYP